MKMDKRYSSVVLLIFSSRRFFEAHTRITIEKVFTGFWKYDVACIWIWFASEKDNTAWNSNPNPYEENDGKVQNSSRA